MLTTTRQKFTKLLTHGANITARPESGPVFTGPARFNTGVIIYSEAIV